MMVDSVTDVIIFVFLIGALVGCVFAQWMTERKWRSNADDYRRVHSGGKLYKVLHDAEYEREVL